MKSIWKYTFEITDDFTIEIPSGAKFLHVDIQQLPYPLGSDSKIREAPCIWVLVDPEAQPMKYSFKLFGTGHPFPDDDSKLYYIGTFKMAGDLLVFHLFHE